MTDVLGLLLVDKPAGPTSHDVVARIRRIGGIRRVGHAGTLDPFASGLLLLLLGSATRLSEYLLGLDKEYEAVVRLGVETSSHDLDGEIVSESGAWAGLNRFDLEEALDEFRGGILQIPPRLSAKKIAGEPAHRRVRRGEVVELEPVEVTVHALEMVRVDLPNVHLRVRCSSGTYIRALARDLGRKLGVGGHLVFLRRTEIGSFSVGSAAVLEELADEAALRARLVPPAQALAHFPAYEVAPHEAARLRNGQFLPLESQDLPEEAPVRVLLDGDLVAVAARAGGELRPRKVIPHD